MKLIFQCQLISAFLPDFLYLKNPKIDKPVDSNGKKMEMFYI